MDAHRLIAEPHLWTAFAYYIIGAIMTAAALRVWWMHPLNRAFLFGDYVTQEGLRVVLRNWAFMLMFGAFIFSCGVEHHLDYLSARGRVDPLVVRFAGVTEAFVSIWTAISVVYVTVRVLMRRQRWKG